MADGVTNIGDGWDGVPEGSAEFALKMILEEGRLTGNEVAQELISEGFAPRGPVYYPVEDGKGPFYALGIPHTYVSIEQGPNGPQWNLTRAEPGDLPVTQPPGPVPAPPVVTPNLDQLTLADISQRLATLETNAVTRDDLNNLRDCLFENQNANAERIQTQIDQAIKNAEKSAAALIPIAEAAIPALSGLLGKA